MTGAWVFVCGPSGAGKDSAALAWHWEAHGFGYGVPTRNARVALDADLVIHNDAAIAAAGARLQCFLEALTRHVHATTA